MVNYIGGKCNEFERFVVRAAWRIMRFVSYISTQPNMPTAQIIAPFHNIQCLLTDLQKYLFFFSIWMMFCVKFSWQYFSGQIDAHEIIVFYTAHTIKHHNCRARSIKGCLWYNINSNIYLIEYCLMLCVYQMLQLIFAKYSHFRKFCVYTDNRNEHHNLRVRCK